MTVRTYAGAGVLPMPAGANANIIDNLCFVSVTPRLYVTLTPLGKLAPCDQAITSANGFY